MLVGVVIGGAGLQVDIHAVVEPKPEMTSITLRVGIYEQRALEHWPISVGHPTTRHNGETFGCPAPEATALIAAGYADFA